MFKGVEETKKLKEYLTFIMDREEYAVPILSVREIQRWPECTLIPNSPDYVLGIVNIRGEVIPIIDLRNRFSLEKIAYSTDAVVIVVTMFMGKDEKTIGLAVDAVADVYGIEDSDIRDIPNCDEYKNNEYVDQLFLVDEKMVMVLQIDNLLESGTLSVIYSEIAATNDDCINNTEGLMQNSYGVR